MGSKEMTIMAAVQERYAFPTMRKEQIDIINKIENAFKTHDFVFLEAPTGIGKSGVVMSLSLRMNDYGPTSFVMTSSKLLQDQYNDDFSEFTKTIKGKNNFDCVDPDTDSRMRLKCDTGRCCFDSNYRCTVKPKKEDFITINRGLGKSEKVLYQGQIKEACGYFMQKIKGLRAGHTVLNYKYFFSLYFYTGELDKRDLMVFDEAHNLENVILDFISINMRPDFYSKLAEELMDSFLKKNLGIEIREPPMGTDNALIWSEYLRVTKEWMDIIWGYYDGTEGLDATTS
ncbi:MAG: DEAD/DEAH box helicase family protein, partial [Nitrososphaerales archaeon]